MHILANPKIKSFVKSISLTSIRGILLVVKFVLTLFIAHFLDLETLGFFGLISAATIMAPSIFGLGITYNIARDAVTHSKEAVSRELRIYANFTFVLYSTLLTGVIFYGYVTQTLFLSIICLCLVFFEQLNSEFFNLFLNLSKPYIANIYHFIRAALWSIIYMVSAYFIPELRHINFLLIFWLIFSIIAFLAFVITFEFPKNNNDKQICINNLKNKIVSQIYHARFLYFNMLATTILQYGDRYIISFFLGLKLTGVYIFFWQISSALYNLISTGVLQLYRPKFVLSCKKNDGHLFQIFKSCFIKTLVISVILSVFTYISLVFTIPYLNKPDIAVNMHIAILIFSGLVVFALSEVFMMILYSHYQDKLSLKITFIIMVLSIILNSAFVYLYGLIGAGISFLTIGSLSLLTRFLVVKYKKLYQG